MSRSCESGAMVVGGQHRLPEDPCEYNPEASLGPGCNQLVCGNCGARVRNSAPGVRNAEGRGRDDAPVLYAIEDWSSSPLVERASATWRLYVCRCDYWVEGETSYVINDHDAPGDPHMNWSCGGHPEPALPLILDALTITAHTDWPALVQAVLDGDCPRRLERANEGPWLWLSWLYAYLGGLPQASQFSRAVGSKIVDRDERTIGAVLVFFRRFPTAEGVQHLLARAEADPESVMVKHAIPEDDYEPSLWDVLIAVLQQRTEENPALVAVEVIRKVLLRAPGRRDPLKQTLERSWEASAFRLADAAWLGENIAALEAVAPGRWKPIMNLVVAFARNDDELESMILTAGVSLIESRRVPPAEIRAWIKQRAYPADAWPVVLESALARVS